MPLERGARAYFEKRVHAVLRIPLLEDPPSRFESSWKVVTSAAIYRHFRRCLRGPGAEWDTRSGVDIPLTSLIPRGNRSRICEGKEENRSTLDRRRERSKGNDYVFHPVARCLSLVRILPADSTFPRAAFSPLVVLFNQPVATATDCLYFPSPQEIRRRRRRVSHRWFISSERRRHVRAQRDSIYAARNEIVPAETRRNGEAKFLSGK